MNKREELIILALFVAFVVAVIVYMFVWKKRHERYGAILGTAAPYRDVLVECLSDCQRRDPTTTLGSDLVCEKHCQSMITDAQKGGSRSAAPQFPLSIQHSERNASSLREFCELEVEKYCQEMVCSHSKSETSQCMADCVAVRGVNCSTTPGWTWMS